MQLLMIGFMSMSLTAKTLLLTGSTGFVGSNVLKLAAESGRYETIYLPVRSLDRMNDVLKRLQIETSTRLEVIEGGGPDWPIVGLMIDDVIHTAGLTSGGDYEEYDRANVSSTIGLLEATSPTSRFLLLSSLAAAGPTGPAGIDEAHSDRPITNYGRSKLSMEIQVLANFANRDLMILRPPMVLGPHDAATQSLLDGSRGPFVIKPGSSRTEQEHWYSFIDVQDLARAILQAIASDVDFRQLNNRIFHVAHNEAFDAQTMFATARSVVGGKGLILPAPIWLIKGVAQVVERIPSLRRKLPNLRPDRVQDAPHSWRSCGERFAEQFGFETKIGLRESLRRAWKPNP